MKTFENDTVTISYPSDLMLETKGTSVILKQENGAADATPSIELSRYASLPNSTNRTKAQSEFKKILGGDTSTKRQINEREALELSKSTTTKEVYVFTDDSVWLLKLDLKVTVVSEKAEEIISSLKIR